MHDVKHESHERIKVNHPVWNRLLFLLFSFRLSIHSSLLYHVIIYYLFSDVPFFNSKLPRLLEVCWGHKRGFCGYGFWSITISIGTLISLEDSPELTHNHPFLKPHVNIPP